MKIDIVPKIQKMINHSNTSIFTKNLKSAAKNGRSEVAHTPDV